MSTGSHFPGRPSGGAPGQEAAMSETVKVGQSVPDFEMEVYDPKAKGFGKASLADLKKRR